MGPPEKRNPRPAGTGARAIVRASKQPEDSISPALFQQDFATDRIAQRFGLTLIRAAAICELSRYGRAA